MQHIARIQLLLGLTFLYTHLTGVIRIENVGAVAEATVSRFDPCSGTFFIGINGPSTEQTPLKYVTRTESNEKPYVQTVGGLVGGVSLFSSIEVLAITPPTTCNPLALFVTSIENNANTVHLTDRCNLQDTSDALNDATCNATSNGAVAIAASDCYALAAVRSNVGNFGATGSGIARLLIEKNPLKLCITNAQTGGLGNCALALDNSSDVLTGGTNDVTFIANDANRVIMTYDHVLCRTFIGVQIQSGATNGDIAKSVAVADSDPTGSDPLNLQTILPNNGAIDVNANEIIVGQTNADNPAILHVLALELLHASTGPSYLVIAGGKEASNTCDIANTIYALPLIDNPSSTTTHATLANKNAALVNGRFEVPATAAGNLANTTDPAAVVGAGPLPYDPNTDSTTVRTISGIQVVGDAVYVSVAGPTDASNDAGLFVSHVQFGNDGKIMGWTPWALRAFPAQGFKTIKLGSTGPSNMQCDVSELECNPSKAISFFAVDAHNAQVWAIQASNSEEDAAPKNIPNISDAYGITAAQNAALVRTNWSIGSSRGTDLLSQLQQTRLRCGSCSALDLNQATPQFACNTDNRYMLFGGQECVIFTRISVGQPLQNTLSTINPLGRPQIIIDRFDATENLLETKLPSGAGPVCTLAYSATSGSNNYFFAGTPNGLYIFSDAGKGFDTSNLGTLNSSPFSNGLWSKVPNSTGAVVDIQSAGNVLYVLVKGQNAQTKLISTVLRIPFDSTINAMFNTNAIEIIAQSGSGDLASVQTINKLAIATTNTLGTNEQLLLATSNGLYCSVSITGTQALGSAVSWMTVSNGEGIYTVIAQSPGASPYIPTCSGLAVPTCSGVTGPTGVSPIFLSATSRQTTIWPVGIIANNTTPSIALAGVIRQFIRASNSSLNCNLIPNPFIAQSVAPNRASCVVCPTLNASDDLCCTLAQSTIKQQANNSIQNASLFLTKSWWSDGGRRLGVTQQNGCDNSVHAQLFALPYNLYRWGFNRLEDGFIDHSLLNNINAIYWISYSGSHGTLLLGTEKGVVGLA